MNVFAMPVGYRAIRGRYAVARRNLIALRILVPHVVTESAWSHLGGLPLLKDWFRREVAIADFQPDVKRVE